MGKSFSGPSEISGLNLIVSGWFTWFSPTPFPQVGASYQAYQCSCQGAFSMKIRHGKCMRFTVKTCPWWLHRWPVLPPNKVDKSWKSKIPRHFTERSSKALRICQPISLHFPDFLVQRKKKKTAVWVIIHKCTFPFRRWWLQPVSARDWWGNETWLDSIFQWFFCWTECKRTISLYWWWQFKFGLNDSS